jgi:mono/diheme cytochrome c family protein
MERRLRINVAVAAHRRLLAALGSLPAAGALVAGCLTGPHAPRFGDAERGRVVFLHHCDRCHPGGGAGLGPALGRKGLPITAFKSLVRLGASNMPAFSKDQISESQLDDLVAFVRAEGKAHER